MSSRSQGLVNALLIAGGIALVILASREVLRVANDPATNLTYFFNGDTLYPAALWKDLRQEYRSLESWRFTGATDFYPDVLIYAAAHGITGNVASAMVLCTCAMFVLLVLSSWLLLCSLTNRPDRAAHLAGLLALSALFLSLNALARFDNYTLRCPLMLTCHGGSTICAIFGLAIVVRLLFADVWRTGHWLLLLALFVQTALCMASDRLIFVQLVAPTVATLVFARLLLGSLLSTRRIIWISVTLIGATVVGQLMLRLVQQPWEDVMQSEHFSVRALGRGLSVAATGTAKHLAAGDVLHSTAVATLALVLGYLAIVGGRRIFGRLDARTIDPRLFLASSWFLAMCASSLGAATLSGMLTASVPVSAEYQWTIGTRYFLPMLLLTFFLLPYTVSTLARSRFSVMSEWPIAASFSAISVIALAATHRQPHGEGQDVWHYYPTQVRELDEAAERLGVRHGFADHHSARVYTMLSRRNLQVCGIMRSADSPSGCAPIPRLGNMHSYFKYGNAPFAPAFIVLFDDGMGVDLHRTPSRSEIVQRFGEPAAIATSGGLPVLFYHRSSDELFQRIPEVDYRFSRESYHFQIRERIRFPAERLPSKIAEPLPNQPHLAREGRDPPSILTDGPEMAMRKKGVYRVRALASSKGFVSAGRLEVTLVDPARNQHELCGVVNLPLGDRRDVSLLINVDERLLGRLLFARVYYHGAGDLEVHSIEVERSP